MIGMAILNGACAVLNFAVWAVWNNPINLIAAIVSTVVTLLCVYWAS